MTIRCVCKLLRKEANSPQLFVSYVIFCTIFCTHTATHTHASEKYLILEFCSHCITDVPCVELLEVSPIFCGSKTTIKCVLSSTPTPENIEWQTSRDGVDFKSIGRAKYFDNTDNSCVIHKATFADKLYYRVRVWNGIGETISNTVYLNVTGSMIFIFSLSKLQVF